MKTIYFSILRCKRQPTTVTVWLDDNLLSVFMVFSDLPVLIMCGGKGSRFHYFDKTVQKCSAPIGQTSIIREVVRSLKNYGFSDFRFLTGNNSRQLREHIEHFMNGISDDRFILDNQLRGTAHAVQSAAKSLPSKFLYHHGNFLISSEGYKQLVTASGPSLEWTCHAFVPPQVLV